MTSQPLRYVANGLAATAVHFAVLAAGLHLIRLPSAGLANLFAAVAGISVSFLGSRYFVFRSQRQPLLAQLGKFWLLYALLAAMHGAILFVWSDLAKFDYRIGFLLATAIQMICTYFGGRNWVFKP